MYHLWLFFFQTQSIRAVFFFIIAAVYPYVIELEIVISVIVNLSHHSDMSAGHVIHFPSQAVSEISHEKENGHYGCQNEGANPSVLDLSHRVTRPRTAQ